MAGIAHREDGGAHDGFVAKISSDGNRLLYSSYLGGTASDGAFGVDVDKTGNAYVVGNTASADFPMVNPFQETMTPSYDAFVAKVSERAFKQPLTATPIVP